MKRPANALSSILRAGDSSLAILAIVALLAGIVYLYFGVLLARVKTGLQARRLLQASVCYLPLIYIALVVDKL